MTHAAAAETTSGILQRTVASPAKALQKLTDNRLSGRLTVYHPQDESIQWRVYLGNGQVHYATGLTQTPERLAYLLQRCCPALKLQAFKFDTDYQFFCRCWQSGQLSLQQVRKLLLLATQEALIHIFALRTAALEFESTVGLDPLLLSVPLKQIVMPVRSQIVRWLQVSPDLNSPFARPYLISQEQFSQFLWLKAEPPARIESLTKALSQEGCLYQVAHQLKLEILELVALLQPLIQNGAVGVRPKSAKEHRRPTVVCIDDSKTIQQTVKLILEASGYQVLSLTEPARALTALVRCKPALILMDITMPEIDGYELCRMLRQSHLLKETPIVMLTGRDGLVDRIRARMVGAADYLTKPFQPAELLSLIEKLIHQSESEGEQ